MSRGVRLKTVRDEVAREKPLVLVTKGHCHGYTVNGKVLVLCFMMRDFCEIKCTERCNLKKN